VAIKIVVVGKTKQAPLKFLERSYLERLNRYVKVQRVAVREQKVLKNQETSRALQNEGKRILREVDREDFCIVLDSQGKEMTSPELADFLKQHLLSGTREVTFVTGGPLGLAVAVKERADFLLSFSRLTFTHEMIRVLLMEQLYRAWTLLRGEKYHK